MRSCGLSPPNWFSTKKLRSAHLADVVVERTHPGEQRVAADACDGLLDEVRDDQRVLVAAGGLDQQALQQGVRRRRQLEQPETRQEAGADLEERQQTERQHPRQDATCDEGGDGDRGRQRRQPTADQHPRHQGHATGDAAHRAGGDDRGAVAHVANATDGHDGADEGRQERDDGRRRDEQGGDDRHPDRPQEPGDLSTPGRRPGAARASRARSWGRTRARTVGRRASRS